MGAMDAMGPECRVVESRIIEIHYLKINTDDDDTEPQEYFYISFEPIRNALYLPPRIEIRICGGKNIVMAEVDYLP